MKTMVLFVTQPWPHFYNNCMKSWEIRSYPIDFRGDVLIVESKTNKVICKMTLTNCVSLTKELWEMNFEKHRTMSSYEALPYKKDGCAFAWVLTNPVFYNETIKIDRPNKKPYFFLDDEFLKDKTYKEEKIECERLACKFLNQYMLIYWIKQTYFALVGVVDMSCGDFRLVTSEIEEDEIEYIVNQINAKKH